MPLTETWTSTSVAMGGAGCGRRGHRRPGHEDAMAPKKNKARKRLEPWQKSKSVLAQAT